ncbi:MAG: hypothetical protein WDZ76_07325 [Pseudohongiellaceae bacterium]
MTTDDADYAAQVRKILTESGIPAYVSCPVLPEGWAFAVYVYIDSQYNDALKVITDPNYVVSHPVDAKEYFQNIDKLKEDQAHKLYNTYMLAGVVAVIFLLIAFAVLRFLGLR